MPLFDNLDKTRVESAHAWSFPLTMAEEDVVKRGYLTEPGIRSILVRLLTLHLH